ncbi:MAG: flagellar motor protein MotB [Stellaceae bacterium]
MAADRRRREQDDKKENNERWVISYADFMTLLLATFVVLYAVSSINVSRYRAAAQAFSNVFNGKMVEQTRSTGAQLNGIFNHSPTPVPLPVNRPTVPIPPDQPKVPSKVRERVKKLNAAYANLRRLLHATIAKGQVQVTHNGMSVAININASVLFPSGSADLNQSALGVIDQIGLVLKDLPYAIQVNGYTDNAPIHTAQFNSNWELSAMRAISVVRRFVGDGVDPAHLVGAGYGKYHPIATNDTPDGRAKNRRVAIIVRSTGDHLSDAKTSGTNARGTSKLTTATAAKGMTSNTATPLQGAVSHPVEATKPPVQHPAVVTPVISAPKPPLSPVAPP